VLVEPVPLDSLVASAGDTIHSLVPRPDGPAPPLHLIQLGVHDLKTPLGNIINLCEVMLAEELERRQQNEFLSSIAANAQAMLKLVMNLLNVAALEAGRLPLRLELVAMHEVVQAALHQIMWLVQRKRVRVSNRVPADLPLPRADWELLVRVFVNLLDNALQHSPDEDEIAAQGEVEGQGVRIDVLDRGPGVPETFRERIFDEFFRVDADRAMSRSTGLGLTFCRLVTEAHGGRIWVSAREGGGSRFSLYLPLRPPERAGQDG
jgi:K+-sensing histidine kinase KdpD